MAPVAGEKVLVLDFGSQYAQLIARRVRGRHVYCEIVRHNISASRIRELKPKGLILSGGPASVYEPGRRSATPKSSASACRSWAFVMGCSWPARPRAGKSATCRPASTAAPAAA